MRICKSLEVDIYLQNNSIPTYKKKKEKKRKKRKEKKKKHGTCFEFGNEF